MSNIPNWQQVYQAALLELDLQKLAQRIVDAEVAIFDRLQTISQTPNHLAERQAIQDSAASLRVLKILLSAQQNQPAWSSAENLRSSVQKTATVK